MNDISYNKWISMSDKALLEQIGSFVKYQRLEQNKTQEIFAHEAGISRSTLSLLENGETVTLTTFIQVMRTLGQLHFMDVFEVGNTISPLVLAKNQKTKKKRARNVKQQDKPVIDW